MPQYKYVKQGNGKYTIEQVPIFGLGTVRDFPYTTEWSERLLARMQDLKSREYFAPVIIGHNDPWSDKDEKEACGFLDNFKVEPGINPDTGTIYADFVDIPEESFQEIAELKYPYRSVEVRNETAEITALALLGGTEPFWKFPRLKVEGFKANPDGSGETTRVGFEVLGNATGGAELRSVAQFGKDMGRKNFIQKFFALVSNYLNENEIEDVAAGEGFGADKPITLQSNKPGMGGRMPKTLTNEEREQFKADYGVYPDEITSLKELAGQVDTFRAAAETSAKEKFEAQLTADNVAPAALTIIGELTGFAAPGKVEELRTKILELVKYARDGVLIVPMKESGKLGKHDFSQGVDFNDQEAVDAAVKQQMSKDPKLSYGEALELVKKMPEVKPGGGE